jgi:hypothetical protein
MKKRKISRKKILLNLFLIILLILFIFIIILLATSINKDNKKQLKNELASFGPVLGNLNLNFASAPNSVRVGDSFEIICDFGVQLSCIVAKHGDKECNFNYYNGNRKVFNCTAEKAGYVDNYCNLVYSDKDNRCFNKINGISDTLVTASVSRINYTNSSNSYNNLSNNSDNSLNSSIHYNNSNNNLGNSSNVLNNSDNISFNESNNSNNPSDNSTSQILNITNSDVSPLNESFCYLNSILNNYCIDEYILSRESCDNNKKVSEKITCPNGCSNGKCIINVNEAKSKRNTLVFAGIYPSPPLSQIPIKVIKEYSDKLSSNINGLAGCCNFQNWDNSKVVNLYHSKGYLVMSHGGFKAEALQDAKDGIDIIIFDEMKMMGQGRGETMNGSEFNEIKKQIKEINPNALVGIVESRTKYYTGWDEWHGNFNDILHFNWMTHYDGWIKEGADPDIVAFEQYYDSNGNTGEPSYDDFMSQVATKFPKARVLVFINTVNQIDYFLGKVDLVVLFGTDAYKIGMLESDWPNFKLEDSENELKVQYGMAQQVLSSPPDSANIKSCKPNCKNKECGGDGCGGRCESCGAGYQCDGSGKCYYVCNDFEKVWGWFGLNNCKN